MLGVWLMILARTIHVLFLRWKPSNSLQKPVFNNGVPFLGKSQTLSTLLTEIKLFTDSYMEAFEIVPASLASFLTFYFPGLRCWFFSRMMNQPPPPRPGEGQRRSCAAKLTRISESPRDCQCTFPKYPYRIQLGY